MKIRSIRAALLLGGVLVTACEGNTENGEGSGGTGGDCPSCTPPGSGAIVCQCKPGNSWEPLPGEHCVSTNPQSHCEFLCEQFYTQPNIQADWKPHPGCTPSDDDHGLVDPCEDWDPERAIVYHAMDGFYEIDEGWFRDVLIDPSPLWECDSARFVPESDDTFEVVNAASTDALYLMGLRNGDVPFDLNGHPLTDWHSVHTAFVELHLNDGETSFELGIVRNSSTMSLLYEVD